MYTKSEIKRAIRNPRVGLRELNSIFHSRMGCYQENPRGVNFFEEDWDNLIILDACRYDIFKEKIGNYQIHGEIESRQSLGSATFDFLQANLDKRDNSDTVYVTATSMLYREVALRSNLTSRFHRIIDVWEDNVEYGEGGVPPHSVTEAAIKAHADFPNKRLVIHYIQPHTPFIGEFAQELLGDQEHAVWDDKLTKSCNISDEDLWEAYCENTDIVLEELERLVSSLSGKTVITADHGQAIGDRSYPIPIKEYGHPSGLYIDVLCKVPYFICQYDSRRGISYDDSSKNYTDEDPEIEDKVTDQLKGLGYL